MSSAPRVRGLPIKAQLVDERKGILRLLANEEEIATAKLLPVPKWGEKRLSSGSPAITIIQQHGARNLVTTIGETRCQLFDKNNACTFCSMKGGASNSKKSIADISEALGLALQERSSYTLTFTTSLLSDPQVTKITEDIKALKSEYPQVPMALEIQPLKSGQIIKLKEAGLDTLMIPLDCGSKPAREKWMPGKALLLQQQYWKSVKEGVSSFGKGNVTSNIILGLEPLEETKKAIVRMIKTGVVPEPLPVRWMEDDESIPLPLANPNDLVDIRTFITQKAEELGFLRSMEKTKAGCAACGGCGGLVLSRQKIQATLSV
jgi:hypothetical protein